MSIKKGTKVKFTTASDEQVNWGGNDDPRELLKTEEIYKVDKIETHSWHTKIYLRGFPGKKFNSVSFKEV